MPRSHSPPSACTQSVFLGCSCRAYSAAPCTVLSCSWTLSVVPGWPGWLLRRKDWICGQGESSGCCFPWIQPFPMSVSQCFMFPLQCGKSPCVSWLYTEPHAFPPASLCLKLAFRRKISLFIFAQFLLFPPFAFRILLPDLQWSIQEKMGHSGALS